jgi:translation initiation factor IF-2
MQSRRLRLGDVVDDYCPRERRLSNHVIVAMVDDTIKQTRCSTCDFEHPFKDGKLPARRTKKDATPALFKQVLDNVTDGVVLAEPSEPPPPIVAVTPPATPPAPIVRGVLRPNGAQANGEAEEAAMALEASRTPPGPTPISERTVDEDAPRDEGPVHRTLIRATLPRIEGEVPTRPIPTFTIREAAAAPKFRRFRPKRGPGGGGGGRPFGDNFGNQSGGFKNPQFSAQPGGRGPGNNGQKPGGGGQPNRGGNPARPGGAPGGGGRRNNSRRGGGKGPR